MSYLLHTSPDSASTIIRLVLEELGAPYEPATIDRPNGALDSPAYRALCPTGKIPVLETPAGPIFETAAILLWLAETHGALAPAPRSPERAAFLKWFVFVTNEVHPTVMQIFYPERVAGPEAAPAVTLIAAARLRQDMGLIETMLETQAPVWLSPVGPSILGYYLATLLRWTLTLPAAHPGRWAIREHPALHTVFAALEQRPAARAVALAEGLGDTIFTSPT